jgi:hypothetical protein
MNKYYAPNHSQLSTAVKGADRHYRIRIKNRPFWLQQFGYAVMVVIILILAFAALAVIAEVLR